jgi:predicted dehydrogenase
VALVSIIGGGRWARTIAGVLAGLPTAPEQIILHSRHNAAGVRAWIGERGLTPKVAAAEHWPDYERERPDAVIVANNAADHDAAAAPALDTGIAVLMEKPMAIGADAVRALLDRAASHGALLAASHVFLFARYLETFASLAARHGAIHRLDVIWHDGQGDIVRGELKSHDTAVSVFDDVLPHIVPVLARLAPRALALNLLDVRDRGAQVTMKADAGGIAVLMDLARDAGARRRLLNVHTDAGICRLDFSTEPGVIEAVDGARHDGDPLWDRAPRPLGAMLAAFLAGARDGMMDPRLSPQMALASAVFADAVRAARKTRASN